MSVEAVPALVAIWEFLFEETNVGNVLIALSVLAIGWWVAKLVVRLLGRPVAQRFRRESVTRTVLWMIRLTVVLFFLAIAIPVANIGVDPRDIVLSVTVISAVIGIILAPIVSNVINGLFVLADRPYEIGDMVEIEDTGQRGFVEDITLRYTKVFTMDNTFLVIPNSTIRERDVINFSAEDQRTRVTFDLVVNYEGDVARARTVMIRSARAVGDVVSGGPPIRIGNARYPAAPVCYVQEYGDHGVHLRMRYWVTNPYYMPGIRSRINQKIWDAFAEEEIDVEFPYPHQHVVFDETSGRARVTVDHDSTEARAADPASRAADGGD